MLIDIIKNYLQISTIQAKNVMDLMSQEKRWQEQQEWKGTKYTLSTMKSQADFISFIQATGQSQWFKGHDRSKFSDTISDQEMNEKYFSLFTGLGLTERSAYDPSLGAPAFSAILGSSESQVTARLDAFTEDVRLGLSPKQNLVFGLGCNRELGVSVVEKEQASKDKLTNQNLAATEMNMVSLLTRETLAELAKLDNQFSTLKYQEINTASPAKTREEKDCVKTGDTASSLKQAIELQFDISQMKKPINISVYSRQPFVLRQQRDVQQKLGSDYNAVGVGNPLTLAEFNKNPKSITICLGEVARLVNINYSAENLKRFDIPLTEAELAEIRQLSIGSVPQYAESATVNSGTAEEKHGNNRYRHFVTDPQLVKMSLAQQDSDTPVNVDQKEDVLVVSTSTTPVRK